MTAFLIDNAGTISVGAGATAVTGTGTGFALAALSGGLLVAGDGFGWIDSVESDTALTLGQAWSGSVQTDVPYFIMRVPEPNALLADATDRIRELIALMNRLDGPDGPRGPTGGAFGYQFAADTAMADPGDGLFRLNDATPENATAIALSAQLADLSDVSDLLVARFGSPATVKCRIVITSAAGRLEFDATAITDNGDWLEASVQAGAIVGALLADSQCEIVFEWRS